MPLMPPAPLLSNPRAEGSPGGPDVSSEQNNARAWGGQRGTGQEQDAGQRDRVEKPPHQAHALALPGHLPGRGALRVPERC